MTAPIPNVAFQFPEDGLGLAPAAPSGIFAVFGASSSGTVNVPQDVAGTPANAIARWGYGPGPSLVGNLVQSGATVVFTRVDSTPVAAGAVTHTGTGLSVMTITGNPFDRYNLIVTVVRAGTAGSDPEPGFTVSLDGGRTVSREIRMPANRIYTGLAATTGMTLNFTAATLVVGDTYESDTSAPTVAASDVADAIDALRQSTQAFSMIYVCGAFDKDDTATIIDAAAEMIPKKRFCRVFTESVDQAGAETELEWMDALEADFAGFESSLSVVAAGYIGVRDVLTGSVLWRSIGHLAAIRAATVQVSRDLAFVGDGPLRPYTNASASDWTPAPGKFVHNEDTIPGLNSNRFMTIRSFVGLNGAYVTNPNMMSGPTSDYDLLQFGRIADAVAFNTNNFFTQQLSRDVLLNPTNGRILEKEAKSLEQGNDSANQELLSNQDVSALRTIVSRADNILTTRTLTVTVKIVPKGYLKTIDVTITFVPSIAAAA
jgi:hypothetical protein